LDTQDIRKGAPGETFREEAELAEERMLGQKSGQK